MRSSQWSIPVEVSKCHRPTPPDCTASRLRALRSASWFSACFCRVISVCTPIIRVGRPAASRSITLPRSRTQIQWPSLWRSRNSVSMIGRQAGLVGLSGLDGPLAIVGMHQGQPEVAVIAHLVFGKAEHLLPDRRVVAAPGRQVGIPDAEAGALEREAPARVGAHVRRTREERARRIHLWGACAGRLRCLSHPDLAERTHALART